MGINNSDPYKEINDYLDSIVKKLEPTDHCCECVKGIKHTVCIKYPNCDCLITKNKEIEMKK